jgi:hypothetical protein
MILPLRAGQISGPLFLWAGFGRRADATEEQKGPAGDIDEKDQAILLACRNREVQSALDGFGLRLRSTVFFVLIGAPYYRRFADVPQVKAFVQGVTAAAVGAIAGAAYILARKSVIDLSTLLIAVVAFAALSRGKKNISEPLLVVAVVLSAY